MVAKKSSIATRVSCSVSGGLGGLVVVDGRGREVDGGFVVVGGENGWSSVEVDFRGVGGIGDVDQSSGISLGGGGR